MNLQLRRTSNHLDETDMRRPTGIPSNIDQLTVAPCKVIDLVALHFQMLAQILDAGGRGPLALAPLQVLEEHLGQLPHGHGTPATTHSANDSASPAQGGGTPHCSPANLAVRADSSISGDYRFGGRCPPLPKRTAP